MPTSRLLHGTLLCCAIIAGCGGSSSDPLPTPSPTRTTGATPTASTAPTASATHSRTPPATPTSTSAPSATATSSPQPTLAPLPVGLAALTDLDALAHLRLPGTSVAQVASYDRSGGNADLGVGPDTAELLRLLMVEPVELDNSYLYRDGERYVIFDDLGPGVLYRIWMTGLDALFRGGLAGDIWFEFDEEAEPRVHLTRAQLFSGTQPPFLAPLAGNSAASAFGFYTALPMAYAQRLRILTSTAPNWLQITYAKLPAGQPLSSFDPLADSSAAAAVLSASGTDPRPAPPPLAGELSGALPPGGEAVWEQLSAGTVQRLELLAPPGAEIPVGVRLVATWDGADSPQVDVPLDDFFGASLGAAARSLTFGREGDRFYSYWSMPFRSRAQIVLRNDSDATVLDGWRLRISVAPGAPPTRAAWFHAHAAAARVEPDGEDYVLLERTGTGHVVGVYLTAGCAGLGLCQLSQVMGTDGSHLEGDEHISVDGSRYPQIHGTGLEDFFNGGFYFLGGPVNLPTHGNPAQPATSERHPGITLRSAYRLLLGDAIPFEHHIRLAIEHGPTNDVPAFMSSVVFYYAIDASSLRETDHITIGDAESEVAHDFFADARVEHTLRSAFRGDGSDTALDAVGIESGRTRFRVRVDPNNRGVRLRRQADIGLGRQSAEVSVDDTPAGTWYTADVNPILRWAEFDYELPASLTSGRDSLEVTLDGSGSPTPWTAYGFTVFSHIDP